MPKRKRNDLLLREYDPRCELVVEQTEIKRAKFPAIDAHCHLGGFVAAGPAAVRKLVRQMDRINIKAIVSLGAHRSLSDEETMVGLKRPFPRRFYHLTALPWEKIAAEKEVGELAAEMLKKAWDRGADGLKIFKELGLRIRDAKGRLIMPSDKRLDPLWNTCSRLGIPVLFHIADPIAFFRPVDRFNEKYEELQDHPEWSFNGPEFPSFRRLMNEQERFLRKHPKIVFQSAHVASYPENLAYVGKLLDAFPNLNVDISARLHELGRQPATAREFLIKYQDRVTHGLDASGPPFRYQRELSYFRFYETRDEYFQRWPDAPWQGGRWCLYGVKLPDTVLRKIYYRNAERIWGKRPRELKIPLQ